MSDPIAYAVVQNLQTSLGAISVVRGYHFTVASTSVKLDPNHRVEDFAKPGGPRPFIILELRPEAWTYQPAKTLKVSMPIRVHWIGQSDTEDDSSRIKTYLQGCADLERAIADDITRGGLAMDTRIVGMTPDESTEGAQVWAMVDLEITLFRVYGQPDS